MYKIKRKKIAEKKYIFEVFSLFFYQIQNVSRFYCFLSFDIKVDNVKFIDYLEIMSSIILCSICSVKHFM